MKKAISRNNIKVMCMNSTEDYRNRYKSLMNRAKKVDSKVM